MSTTPTEIWNNILKDNVGKDDPLWKEYLDKAAVFDVRMVDEWNKIVDVLLVYVALFISVLTAFIIQTLPQLQRNPADITNNLLVAIYSQLQALSNNTSIPPVDPKSYFSQHIESYDGAVIQNALLYISLSLSIIVSVLALVAKLWLVSYSRQAFSVGSPYDRAMKRQEAYNGTLVWNMGGVINMLPVILLIALFLFGAYVFSSIYILHANINTSIIELGLDRNIFKSDFAQAINYIGTAIESLLSVGWMFLGFTSLGGAFVPGFPFHSPFSDVIRFISENLQTFMKRITYGCFSSASKRLRRLWIGTFTFLWIVSNAACCAAVLIAFPKVGPSVSAFPLFFFPAATPIAFSAQQEVVHKPQKYKIPRLAAWTFLFITLPMTSVIWLGQGRFEISISIYITGLLGFVFACWMFSKMSKSMAETGEIDAIAWLLITAPPQHLATFFRKAGQMTGLDSIGRHYRPRLLESLMPLLTLLITSYHAPEHHTSDTHSPSSEPRRNFKIELKREQSDYVLDGRYRLPTSLSLVDDDTCPIDEDPHLKNLEIYTACLARLSEFKDCEGSFWCLREDAMQHPKLEQQLIDKLVEFANPRHHFRVGLRSAATKVLNNYELDMEGKSVESPDTVLSRLDSQDSEQGHPNLHRPVDTDSRVEPAHSTGEIEEVKREKGDSGMC